MEDGEIPSDSDRLHLDGEIHIVHDSSHGNDQLGDVSGAIYSPALAWPGDPYLYPLTPEILNDGNYSGIDNRPRAYSAHERNPGSCSHSSLRFLVQQSSVLPKKHTLAVIDGYPEVQFGRDIAPTGSDIPRIRLKEMAVSKLHATVFWDHDRHEWAVVDMGSKHGTFHRSSRLQDCSAALVSDSPVPLQSRASSIETEDHIGVRLSPPRVSSMPRPLKHLDCLTIGDTTFRVHIHRDQLPCADCSPKGGMEIPLFTKSITEHESAVDKKRKRDAEDAEVSSGSRVELAGRDPKKALTMLKRNLLSLHAHATSSAKNSSDQYVDRSARRRALYPKTSRDELLADISKSPRSPSDLAVFMSISPSSAPSTPLTDTNIGHLLLMKQGWTPGTTLGQPESSNTALSVPLEVTGNVGRVGLGMHATSAANSGTDWKESAKMRRWASSNLTKGKRR
ncbi:hypothetical protein AcW1_008261 [Taiwanofungus camphoratus]|nr:hypothetical protein AcV5_008558 [Antrodia cinnamomea]KAI0951150.1 hypothetical protein AcW1_008261 [Antrodia cinnamomea]KAI0956037.1 hypothetical protein AcV7_006546 [Antrodia cinnamomea]